MYTVAFKLEPREELFKNISFPLYLNMAFGLWHNILGSLLFRSQQKKKKCFEFPLSYYTSQIKQRHRGEMKRVDGGCSPVCTVSRSSNRADDV